MSIRLYVGNLPKEEIDRQELQTVFAEAGDSISTKVIKDRKTGKCRGFGFVTVPNDEQADQFIEKFNGYVFKDSALKIEKALPRSKGQGEEDAPPPQPVIAANRAPSSSPAPSGDKGGRRNNKKRNRGASNSSGGNTSVSTDAVQPDPRWAQELEKLKQMLAAQTTNP
ncbi:RNA recognition motif domain-containing protein [Argonema antarcticum]|uniref:RNA recognition motif domain-containing protein n=1 Tax=Argonema antarcticum TaxID=2942763 RepID=UPI0020121E34|nr:RNA-binding protein [Argonema antarcticum]MCL1471416.1 RNA-binding protein [Argonema antarcticum A004/B2]